MKIKLERNPMPAGELTSVQTEVRNLGSSDLTWFHDGCATLVEVYGEMAQDWRPGVDQTDIRKEFKDRALDLAYRDDPRTSPFVSFVPAARVGRGSYGCADVGISEVIAPGASMKAERVWEGFAGLRWGPPPTGPVTLTGTFGFYWRGKEPANLLDQTIDVKIDAFISNGADQSWLSPPEIVDAALTDEAFVDYLATQNLGNGRTEVLWYRPHLRVWEVGLLVWYEDPKPMMRLLHVDPHSGEILDRVDRPWDEEADGIP